MGADAWPSKSVVDLYHNIIFSPLLLSSSITKTGTENNEEKHEGCDFYCSPWDVAS